MLEKNPHSHAVNAYGSTMAETDPRALEGSLLLKSSYQLEDVATRMKNGETLDFIEIGGVLEYNQKLWTVFVGDTMDKDHPLPQDIKNNIASLGVFIFNRTRDLMISCTPEKMKILIDINRNIASGLMKQARNAAAIPPKAPGTAQAAPAKQETDSLV